MAQGLDAALGPLVDSFMRADEEYEAYTLIFEHDIDGPMGAARQGEL